MSVTRADFLRYASIAAGLTVVLPPARPGEAAPLPVGPDGMLDSQRFRHTSSSRSPYGG